MVDMNEVAGYLMELTSPSALIHLKRVIDGRIAALKVDVAKETANQVLPGEPVTMPNWEALAAEQDKALQAANERAEQAMADAERRLGEMAARMDEQLGQASDKIAAAEENARKAMEFATRPAGTGEKAAAAAQVAAGPDTVGEAVQKVAEAAKSLQDTLPGQSEADKAAALSDALVKEAGELVTAANKQ